MKKTLKPRKFLLLTFVLFFCLFSFFENAAAELIPMNWEKIRLSLDCDGQTLKIDALTSLNIPSVCNEWMVEDAGYSEKQLRKFLSVASPGHETIDVYPTPFRDIILYDDVSGISADSSEGSFSVSYPTLLNKYGGATSATKIFFSSFEQENHSVPSLANINYQEALARIMPLIQASACQVSTPLLIEAWNAHTLAENAAWHKNLFPKNNYKLDWAGTEEIYKTVFPVYYNNIRLHYGNRKVFGNFVLTGSSIRCTISSDKILSFRVEDCRFHNPRALSSPQPILSLDAAIESYRQYLSASFEDVQKNKVIDKILLEWLVLKDGRKHPNLYHLIPAWCFYYKYVVDEMDYEYYEVDKIHALTGEYLSY